MSVSILIMFHCKQNTGYAIGTLEKVFEEAASKAGFSAENIYVSFKEVFSPSENVLKIDYHSSEDIKTLRQLINEKNVETILAFDLPQPSEIVRVARAAKVSKILAYWGASMSSINGGLKLFLKRCQWLLQANISPDLFIFESRAMQRTATHGRGIPKSRTTVIPLGVDTSVYVPTSEDGYTHSIFDIPRTRKIVIYSGHMEERKGVRVLISAMLELERRQQLEDIHLLICGDEGDQSQIYEAMLQSSKAKDHVTFGGYRSDMPQLMRSAYLGTIASTGWDSFTMSSIEMMASGLPLVVSNLQGLAETIEDEVCGYYIQPGDYETLASIWTNYVNNADLRNRHSRAARSRVEELFSVNTQINQIADLISPNVSVDNSIVKPIQERT
ncbi:Glycosyltransferase involved in cell wall bisynthesis [Marinobacter sp. es.042]|uniref:glycosyltransferase family 4 protein n=1 Tax=Marinobacter sp. es.042 TaxID=1761794 RepID=UPI000B503690|nr:glycosyltransferase family 4 protein [Marinobacter sp. es.042]SNB55503.1 Glycosyltransferase involved in cell wall bisynthesis [Marinobacter sp. es.042]